MKPEHPSRGSLALALIAGAALTALFTGQDAIGYPAGAVISAGNNPVVSKGGSMEFDGSTATMVTAPADQDVVLTDLLVGMSAHNNNCFAEAVGTISTDSETEVAVFSLGRVAYSAGTSFKFESGIRVPAGESATLSLRSRYLYCLSSNYEVHFTVSGYLAQP